jgi:phosphoglucomutase
MTMKTHPLAGRPLPPEQRIDPSRVRDAYFRNRPDPEDPAQRVAFGTSGHRGTSLATTFNEAHVLAMAQAVADYRREAGITGPLYLGIDTHALSEPARETTVEVLAANGVELRLDRELGYTPTPVISHAILTHNREVGRPEADGIILTPSHNPPEDGGFKYNPPTGGPAGGEVTGWIQERANRILAGGGARGDLPEVQRFTWPGALKVPNVQRHDYAARYVQDLGAALDLEAVAGAGLRLGADPMGGAGVGYWERIAEVYGLELEVVNPRVDPTFSFIPVDRDGVVRMDCSSRWAMAELIGLRDRFDVAFGNDPDFDRHGIVTREGGLMNPNHFLSAAVDYLFRRRPQWSPEAGIGKTLVTTSMLDRVAKELGRPLNEVPVGFKWFVEGLLEGSIAFGGEESAGASFLRRDGSVWTTDKDGFLLALLAAEMTAVTGKDPAVLYRELEARHGSPSYARSQAPASPREKEILRGLSPEMVEATELAGSPVEARLTRAPGNGAPLGGLKVVTADGWFAARPSGTEEIYKIYAESFLGPEHLERLMEEATELVGRAFRRAEG